MILFKTEADVLYLANCCEYRAETIANPGCILPSTGMILPVRRDSTVRIADGTSGLASSKRRQAPVSKLAVANLA